MERPNVCDIGGCGEDAVKSVDACHGYITMDYNGKPHKPFECVRDHHLQKTDLCCKHYRAWCKATYTALWGVVKNER